MTGTTPSASCQTCAVLRRERDEALERVRQREAVADGDMPALLSARLGLTPMQGKFMAVLMEREAATKQVLFDVLYGDDPNGGPFTNVLAVMVCHLRQRLRPHGIEIATRWGIGWQLAPDMKAKVRELIVTTPVSGGGGS